MRSSRIGITKTLRIQFRKMEKMDNRENSLFYAIALTLLPSLNKVVLQKLYSTFGSAESVFEVAKEKEAEQRLGRMLVHRVRNHREAVFRTAQKEMDYIIQQGIKTFLLGEENYPYRLAQCPDAPIVLFGKGKLPLNRPRQLAVVGSRHPTDYGQQLSHRTVEALAVYRPVIVSGLASGVDGIAHECALKSFLPTIGVLGHGLKSLFPAAHRQLLENMMERGGVLTEYISDVPPLPQHFPPRNRIIAGLSDAVVVVEARRRSGALITANLGFSYNREVFAYPGRIGDAYSEGCNNLIRQNKASLLMEAAEIAEILQWRNPRPETPAAQALTLPLDLTDDERKVYEAIVRLDKPDADTLAEVTGFSIPDLSMLLLSLECKSVVESVAGQRYRQV